MAPSPTQQEARGLPAPRQKVAQPERAVPQWAAAREALTTSPAAAPEPLPAAALERPAAATPEPGLERRVATLEDLALQQARAVGPAVWEWPAAGVVRVGEVARGVRSVEWAAH